jgi:hypothetical protein
MTVAMPITCAADERARYRRWVAAHFAGRISIADERALREHLPACGECRRFYARAHVLSSVDPRGPAAQERLARGLGLRSPRRSPFARLAWVVPALALASFWLAPRALSHLQPEAPTPRGLAAVTPPALLAYRIETDGAPHALGGDAWIIQRGDELAFAYSNPSGWPYLMIFAVDEHAHVYWYHPAWRLDGPPPAAVTARVGPGPFELPSATRHELDGRRLMVHAVFARRTVGVEEIERAAQAARDPHRLTLPDDLLIVRRPLEVLP